MQKRIFKNYPDHIHAVGFKLFYYHAKQDNWTQVWDYIKDEEVKIIHLKRRNLLKVHLSRELAERTGNWVNKKYNAVIALDPQKCARDFERTERWWSEYDSYFGNSILLEVWFEDIVADGDLWIAKIMDFLDISSPEKKLTPTTKRQSAKSASGLISNYEEVKKKFIGTKWEHLFE